MSTPRSVTPKRTLLITRKCVLGQFLLTPNLSIIGRIFLFLMAHFAQHFGIEVHAVCVLANHYHAVLTDHRGVLPDFLRELHHLVSKIVNLVRGRSGLLWNERQCSVVQCATPEDAFRELIYTLTNPVKDHLVERVSDWPGLNSLQAMLGDSTLEVKRPGIFFGLHTSVPEVATIRFTRPPGFAHLTQAEWNDKVLTAVRAVEANAARERAENQAANESAARHHAQAAANAVKAEGASASAKGASAKGGAKAARAQAWSAHAKAVQAQDAASPAHRVTRVLGRAAIQRQSPTDAPPPKPKTKGAARRLNPTIAAKDPFLRKTLLEAQKAWRAAYRKAFKAHQKGDRHVVFPYGTWQRRLDSAVDCHPAPGLLPIPYAAALREAA